MAFNYNHKHHFSLIITLLAIITFSTTTSCDKNKDDDTSYTIPTTYDFANVSYSGQIQRLDMFSEFKSYMATSKTQGVALDADKMKALYANSENAGWSGTYEDSKQMKNKTLTSEQDKFETLIDELAEASQSTVAGGNGVAGVIQSLDGAKSYLIGEDGLDHAQIIEKGLMGALVYHQATGVYLESGKMDVDNTEITDGEGTEMEHHWDEAFGYLGVSTDFPSNTNDVLFWGNYAVKRDPVLDCNTKIMNAFLEGRTAISNKDLTTRDEAIVKIREQWELIAVGSAIHYIKNGIEDIEAGDVALYAHGLSEAIGFIYALKFNPTKKINNSDIDALLVKLADSANFDEMTLNNITVAKLNDIKSELVSTYGLENEEANL